MKGITRFDGGCLLLPLHDSGDYWSLRMGAITITLTIVPVCLYAWDVQNSPIKTGYKDTSRSTGSVLDRERKKEESKQKS